MAQRNNFGRYEVFELYDKPDAGPTPTGRVGSPKRREAGHSPVFVEKFSGLLRRITAEAAQRAGLEASRQYAKLERHKSANMTEKRLVKQLATGHWWEITSTEPAPTYLGVTMTATLRRTTT